MSKKLNKSNSTIYDYLKKGKLKGVKSEGIWKIEYKKSNKVNSAPIVIQESEDLNQPSDTIKTIVNENFYKNSLSKILKKYKAGALAIKNHLSNEVDMNKNLLKIEGSNKFLNKLPQTLEEALEKNETYKIIKENTNKKEKELESLLLKYEELNEIIKPLVVDKIQYSRITDSVYIDISKRNLISFINRLSEINKRFVIINEDLMNLDIIKVRFSNHIPDYYKESSLTLLKKEREVDVIVPYKDLEENFNIIPKKQSENDKIKITKILEKIDIAKKYSNVKVKKLSKTQLEDFYKITNELLNEESTKNDRFVQDLKKKQPLLLKCIDKLS